MVDAEEDLVAKPLWSDKDKSGVTYVTIEGVRYQGGLVVAPRSSNLIYVRGDES